MFRAKGHPKIQCSYGWYRRWCKRFKLSTCPHESSDEQILSWLLEQYDNNDLVTYRKLQAYTQSLQSSSPSITNTSKSALVPSGSFQQNFKASHGWATRFFKRNHLFINWYGHYTNKLPTPLETAKDEFLQELQLELFSSTKSKSNDVDRIIIALDEIPLSFASNPISNTDADNAEMAMGLGDNSCQFSSNVDVKASRLRRITIKNCEATVILCLLNDGSVLPPMVVVKGQKSSNWNQVYIKTDNPVIVYYSESTEPTIKCLEKWLDLILMKELPSIASSSPLLIWDSYILHSQMMDKCRKLGISTKTFPPGCSCKLQPINVLGRQLLLKHIEKEWINYHKLSNSNKQCTRINLPCTDDIVDWVHKAYQSMESQKELLKDSFRILEIQNSAE